MSLERDALRKEAKAVYKEQTKGIPKNQRIPFSQFLVFQLIQQVLWIELVE